jgi:sugar diacid utilization regulator
MKESRNYILGRELILLPALSGCRVLSSDKTLDNMISSANVVEVPDIEQWARNGDLLVTTLYPFRNELEVFEKLIPKLAEKGIMAIAIKPKRFIEMITEQMISNAQKSGILLIELAAGAVFSDIVFETVQAIAYKSLENRSDYFQQLKLSEYQDRFITDWITGNISDVTDILLFAEEFGVKLSKDNKYRVAIIFGANEKNDAADTEDDMHLRRIILRRLKEKYAATVNEGQYVVILEDGKSEYSIQMQDCLEICGKEFHAALSQAYPLNMAAAAYMEAKRICRTAQVCRIEKQIIRNRDLGVYTLIAMLPQDGCIEQYITQIFKPVIDYDRQNHTEYMKTVQVYVEEKMNARSASKKLFIHYNTMNNRLERLKTLLQTDMNNADDILQIELALKLYQIEGKEKRHE